MTPGPSIEKYALHYWPTIPGRGEFIRLCFEASGTPFKDETDIPTFQKLIMARDEETIAPAHFAPPILEVKLGSDPKLLYISQTPAILAYLAPKLGLLGDAEKLSGAYRDVAIAQISQICLSALDLTNEVHDTHHPIAVADYYEQQKAEASKKAQDVRQNRIPKFFKVFELDLSSNPTNRRRLYGGTTTVADLTVFQLLDGLLFAFPRYMASLRTSNLFDKVFEFHAEMADELHKYLNSARRRDYSDGVFRYYAELDTEWSTPTEM